jgi:hypothetical protein
MPVAHPTLVVNVSLTGSDRDYDEHDLPPRLRVARGRNGDVAAAESSSVRPTRPLCIAVGIGRRERPGLRRGVKEVERVKRATTAVPVADAALRDVLRSGRSATSRRRCPVSTTRTVVLVA